MSDGLSKWIFSWLTMVNYVGNNHVLLVSSNLMMMMVLTSAILCLQIILTVIFLFVEYKNACSFRNKTPGVKEKS